MVSAFLLCVSFEMMGLCEGNGGKLYSRRLTPCGRGLMAPPGLTALGAKGSACDRLRLTGGLRAPALGSYIVSLRWRGTAPSAPFFIPPLAAKTIQPPYGQALTGLRVLKFDGAIAPRVLKFDSGSAAEGCGRRL